MDGGKAVKDINETIKKFKLKYQQLNFNKYF